MPMTEMIINELKDKFSENRCGARFELSFEGADHWTALVQMDPTKESGHAYVEARNLAYIMAKAPEMVKEIHQLKEKIKLLEKAVAECYGRLGELRGNLGR